MKRTRIHLHDAIRLLKDGQAHRLRVWKLTTGELLTYEGARHIGGHTVRGSLRVRLPQSALIRQFKEVALYEIDDLKTYL